jgi:hypothetical protein
MDVGKSTLDESGSALKRILVKVAESKQIGVDTAIQVQEQTNQIEGIYDDLYQIEGTIKRSQAIMKRMFRSVRT